MTHTEDTLKHAREWMQRQVAEQRNTIPSTSRNEEDIMKSLSTYFPAEVYMSFSETSLKEILWSELLYDLQSDHPDIDGSTIILWYQKVFDTLVEKYITKALRRYIKQYWELPSPQNFPLEKFLFQVCNKGFILSSGRLYELLKSYNTKSEGLYYTHSFYDFLEKNIYIKKSLLESDFLLHLQWLSQKKILWEKRHLGIVSREDTEFARQKYIWALKEKNSLLSILAKLWSVDG